MILSIGEILIDTFCNERTCTHCIGGAPFNVAVNAKQCGATVGFVGCVGSDELGKIAIDAVNTANLDYFDIDVDFKRATTEALVTLVDGERTFRFNRNDTADYHVDAKKIDLGKYPDLNVVHLGSLMLSEEIGRKTAAEIVRLIRDNNLIMSFDVNFRLDLYENVAEAIAAYEPFVKSADVVKFSDDEILLYTGEKDLEAAVKKVTREGQLLLITLGKNGSEYVYNGRSGAVPTIAVTPIDTTGAGDAFFGAVLAYLDGRDWTIDNIEKALELGNKQGAQATQYVGAIRL